MSIQIKTEHRNALNAAFMLWLFSFSLLLASVIYRNVTPEHAIADTLLWIALALFFAGVVLMAFVGALGEIIRRVFGPFMTRSFWAGLVVTGLVVGLYEAVKLL